MQRMSYDAYRQLPAHRRVKIGLAHYEVDSYLAPIVSHGIDAIDRLCADIPLRDFDEDSRAEEEKAYRRRVAAIIVRLRDSLIDEVEQWDAVSEAITEHQTATTEIAGLTATDAKQLASAQTRLAKAQATLAEAQAAAWATKRDTATILGTRINWPHEHRALKTWAGQVTLRLRLAKLLTMMDGWDRTCDALDYSVAFSGVSGVMPGDAGVTSMDMGFSPNGVPIVQYPMREIAMLIGVQFAPITMHAAEARYWITHEGHAYSWTLVNRGTEYLFAWLPGSAPIEAVATD